jgi:hypothetical protein
MSPRIVPICRCAASPCRCDHATIPRALLRRYLAFVREVREIVRCQWRRIDALEHQVEEMEREAAAEIAALRAELERRPVKAPSVAELEAKVMRLQAEAHEAKETLGRERAQRRAVRT